MNEALFDLGLIRPLAKMPKLRGFVPFVIDPKLVMNSTIC